MKSIALILTFFSIATVGYHAEEEKFINHVISKRFGPQLPHKMESITNEKEIKIRQLLSHIIQQNNIEEQVRIAKEYNVNNNFDETTRNHLAKDIETLMKKPVLPKYRLFRLSTEKHSDEVKALYRLLVHANDFDAFFNTACWARERLNEMSFMFAFMMALHQRDDCKKITIPAPYEVYPFFFAIDDVLQKCSRIKEQGYVTDIKLAARYGLYCDGDHYTITSNFATSFDKHDIEQKLSYYTNDIGLGSFYFDTHAQFPIWLDAEKYNNIHNFVHQQLLARYNLERLSNNLPEIEDFSWDQPIKSPFNPALRYHNGKSFPIRSPIHDMRNEYNLHLIKKIKSIENCQHGCMAADSKEHLAISSFLLGAGMHSFNENDYVPSALEQYQTAPRDPMFYRLHKHRMLHLHKPKDSSLSSELLIFPGVSIDSVDISDLRTFMEDHDFDVTNVVYMNKKESDTNINEKTFSARQRRLNHEPFFINITISSTAMMKATVRTFLGPKYDYIGRPLKLDYADFMQMDNFEVSLQKGKNTMVRKDTDLYRTQKDAFKKQLTDSKIRFPPNLIIPRGKEEGMTFKLYIVALYGNENKKEKLVDFYPEDIPYAFPFDRNINEDVLKKSNVILKDIQIFHVNPLKLNAQ